MDRINRVGRMGALARIVIRLVSEKDMVVRAALTYAAYVLGEGTLQQSLSFLQSPAPLVRVNAIHVLDPEQLYGKRPRDNCM